MTYPIPVPNVATLTCTCGRVLTVHNGVAVRTELVSGGAE